MRCGLTACGLLSWILPSVSSAEAPAKAPPVTNFDVHATPEPSPALKYRLLPSFLELKPGNAGIVYTKISVEFGIRGDEYALLNKVADWLDEPIEKLPRAEVEAALARHNDRLAEASRAARLETCDWQLPVRGEKPWLLMLPEMQGIRQVARLLALRTRLEIADHKYDDALRDLQTGFAMARHVADQPTVVGSLVGAAVAGLMLREVESLMRAPNAPNLYWAIMALPRPLVDLRQGMDAETYWADFAFPRIAGVDVAKFTPEQWREQLVAVAAVAPDLMSRPMSELPRDPELLAAAMAIKGYPHGKQLLIAAGVSPQDVEQMPVAQVVLRGMIQDYERLRDDSFKWRFVPFWQRGNGPDRAADDVRCAQTTFDGFPFVNLLSWVQGVSIAQMRIERLVAINAAVEALRMHAAASGGQLPARLSDVTLAPVLDDPSTGQPFSYSVTGNTATITSAAPRGFAPEHFALHYQITIKP
jgi:hypothetical protein